MTTSPSRHRGPGRGPVVELPYGLPGLRGRAVPLRVDGEPRIVSRTDAGVQLEWQLILGARRFAARTSGTLDAASGAVATAGHVLDGPLRGAAVRASGVLEELRERRVAVAATQPALARAAAVSRPVLAPA